jgi:pimeloyl-ACP methyl ester carboxylesterase
MSLSTAERLDHLRLGAEIAGVAVGELVLPEEHDVVVNGVRLHYLDWGGDGRPALLFLHGGGLTAHTWDLVCLALRADYRCLALDQRGHGDSEWSPNLEYGPDAHARDIAAFVELVLGPERPVLIGHSMGGMNAMTLAVGSAELAGLVLVDVGPEIRADAARGVAEFIMRDAELDSVEDFVERAQAFNPSRDPRLLRRSLLHNLRQLPDGRWTWKYDRRGMTPQSFAALRGRLEDLRRDATRIPCPTLVVRGARSSFFSDEDAARFAGTLPRGEWTRVEDAGHTVQGDNPRGLVEVLRAFLEPR